MKRNKIKTTPFSFEESNLIVRIMSSFNGKVERISATNGTDSLALKAIVSEPISKEDKEMIQRMFGVHYKNQLNIVRVANKRNQYYIEKIA